MRSASFKVGMNLKTGLRGLSKCRASIEDSVVIAYDIKGRPLGAVEYRNGKLVRWEMFQDSRRKSKHVKANRRSCR